MSLGRKAGQPGSLNHELYQGCQPLPSFFAGGLWGCGKPHDNDVGFFRLAWPLLLLVESSQFITSESFLSRALRPELPTRNHPAVQQYGRDRDRLDSSFIQLDKLLLAFSKRWAFKVAACIAVGPPPYDGRWV